MKSKRVFLVGALALLAVPFVALPVAAQNTSSSQSATSNPNGLTISPVRSDIALDPGQSKTMTVYVQNLKPTPVQVRAVVSDFQANKDESGTPLVILDDKYAESHSLKRLAKIDSAIISLAGSERKGVPVTISVPKATNAGGYFGVVRFLPASDLEQDESGVAVSTNVGSLVLLKVNGETKRSLTLESMELVQGDAKEAKTFFNSNKDIKLITRFNNKGNLQEQPFGKVQLLKGDKVLETIEINNNQPRANVLPDSIRRFENKIEKIGKFGKYTVSANLSYTDGGEILTNKMSFWVVPTPYIIGGAVGLLLLGGVGFLIFKVISLSRRSRGGHARRY